jgi:thiamine transport system ATP-binding protein
VSELAIDLRYGAGARTLHSVLETKAKRVAIVGRSGIGKSSLLRAIVGVHDGVGRVLLHGQNLAALPIERRVIGWVPQDGALFPHLDVRRNVGFASDVDVEKLAGLLALAPLLDRSVGALSGGERQRVAIARALAARPNLLVLDEPISALDRDARERVAHAIEEWRAVFDFTVVLASHDEMDVAMLADDVYVMAEDGTLVPRTISREIVPG